MSIRFSVALLWTAVTTSVWLVAGCNQGGQGESAAPGVAAPAADAGEDDYNPHDAPITDEQKAQLQEATAQFTSAVAKIKEFRVATEEQTKDGIPENPYEAHQALDKADLVLQWLPQIARDSGVAKEHWEEINTAANDLRTSFEKVHQNIDSKQDPDFTSVAKEIDQKISRLEELAHGANAAGKEE